MKYPYLFSFFLLLSIPVLSQRKLSVLTYNIHHGANEKNADRIDSMAYFIAKVKPDIVGLQEVDSLCRRSGGVDQAKRLAEQNGLYYAFGRHRLYDGGAYGQAILSKYPIANVRHYNLPTAIPGDNGTVNFIVAIIEVTPRKKIQVSVAHLDYRDNASRVKQAGLILDYLKDSPYPNILMGDMNSYGDGEPLKLLYGKFNDLDPMQPVSYPATDSKKKIDYILTEKNTPLQILSSEAVKVFHSDHLPVLSRIRLK